MIEYFVQAGAFKSEANAEILRKKIQDYDIATNVGINSVYNNGLYRLKLGPFDNKQDADQAAANIRKQLNTSAIIVTQ
jgi:rare lipoprotein A